MLKQIISGKRRIYGLLREEYNDIKDQLKLVNPAYVGAVSYSRYGSYTRIPEFLHYVSSGEDAQGVYVDIPVGVSFKHLGIDRFVETTDLREEKTVEDFPKFKLNLRNTQAEAYKAWIKDTDNGMIQLPTGKGKSILAMYCAAQLKQKTLIIVHKTDLLLSWKADLKLAFGDSVKNIGIIQGKKFVIGKYFTLAMIQTLSKLPDLERINNEFGMVVVDECHNAPANRFNLLNDICAPYKIGLSATPERNDGLDKVMNYYFGDFAIQFEATRQDEDILPVNVEIMSDELNPPILFYPHHREWIPASMVYGTFGTEVFDNFDVKNFVEYSEIPSYERPTLHVPNVEWAFFDRRTKTGKIFLHRLATDIKKCLDKGRSCVVFVTQKKYAESVYEMCLLEKIPENTMQLFYGDSEENDALIIERAENRERLLTICTYAKASEGTNVKAWEVGFLASTVNNGKGVEQVLGRIRRTKEGKHSPAIIYDYAHTRSFMLRKHLDNRIERYKRMKCKVYMNNI